MDTNLNGRKTEWTQSQMDMIPNEHNPEWSPSRMDTKPNGHNSEWALTSICSYLDVLYVMLGKFYVAD